jgi:pimeloyl-ACP methyl ester carboxylesterase
MLHIHLSGDRDMTQGSAKSGTENHMDSKPFFAEHHVPREQGRVYARDYRGAGPAFVLMHGFPDNLHIWDDLIPYRVPSGRRVVAFDFLGFGASDKPSGATYSFQQQLGDLETVVDVLGLGKIVPVAHDASGPAAINFAIEHPDQVNSVCMLNSVYADATTVQWPEIIELFATKSLNALAGAIARSPEQFGWLLNWQKQQFQEALTDAQRAHYDAFLYPLIADNFMQQPSSGPAFAQMTAQFFEEIARNIKRLPELEALDVPFQLIWGEADPYLPVSMAEERRSHLKQSSLHVVPAGHWLQLDEPEQVAKAMLS